MQISRTINYSCIIVGGLVALYEQSQEEQNSYLLVIGLALLIFGIYRTSRNIPSRYANKDDGEDQSNAKD